MGQVCKKIYCDFDGTISKTDSVNDFLKTFAHKNWLDEERLWQEGKISSKECLERQVKLLPNMDEKTLSKYIDSIKLDEYFVEFYDFIKSRGQEIVILSDGFDFFISEVLKCHSLGGIEFYANNLTHKDNRFSIHFYNYNNECKIKAGNCKCSKITQEEFCYIGDGTSDICVAKKATRLFAKGGLKKYCNKINMQYDEFETFKDVLQAFRAGGNI